MEISDTSYVFPRSAIRHYTGAAGPIGIMSVSGRDTLTQPHRHEFSELTIVVRGEGRYQHGTQNFSLRRGDLFVLPPGMPHWYREEHNLELINLLYLEPELPLPWRDLEQIPGFLALFRMEPESRAQHHFHSHLSLPEPELQPVLSLIHRLRSELSAHPDSTSLLAVFLLGELFVLLSRSYAGRNPAPRQSLSLLQLERALHYLKQHYPEPISRAQLAHVAAMSESTFFRTFKQATGLSLRAYLLAFRLDRAAELLRTTSMPLHEIASACGFSDPSYLSRQFHRRFHLPPHHYRLTFFSR